MPYIMAASTPGAAPCRVFSGRTETVPERFQQPLGISGRAMSLQAFFEELIDLPPGERAQRLRVLPLSEGDRQRLQAMLAATTTQRNPLLEMPLGEVIEHLDHDDAVFARMVGRKVGPFRILESIGEGGSAAVFRASRPAGSGEQLVALKVLRTSMFSPDGERRFRREQAILAQLTHPNVARLIEGGVDESGHAFIAMELVLGEPITRAASARQLGIEQRLQWFVGLAHAIDAAHHALVVHCDLKPSNVLVDDSGTLKVLDFGIARLIDTSRDDHPTRTIALTPEYAAPEQFQIGPPRISVDVYALGVMLGELLTGQRLGGASGRLASAAVSPPDAPEPPAGLPRRDVLARRLTGDLDAIITMATEQDPALRYASAEALAEDVERYLGGRPVRARVPTRRYRLRKFIRRHRVPVATAALVVLALFAGLGAAWWQALRAQRAAREAQAQAARAESMRNMVFDVFSEAEPGGPRPGEATVSEAAEHAIATLLADRKADPHTRLELLARFADTVGRQGHPDRAQELLEQALVEAKETLRPGTDLAFSIEERLAGYEIQRGFYAAARRRIDRLLAQVPASPSVLRVRLLRSSASAAWRQRDRERALQDGNLAVAMSRQLGDTELQRDTLTYFGAALLGVGAVHEAVGVYQKLLDLSIAKYGPTHGEVSLALSGLARAYRRVGDLPKAEAAARRALEIDRSIYPHDHWITANHQNALTMILIRKRDYAGALDSARESLRITDSTLDENHIDRLADRYEVGAVLTMMERYDDAAPYLREALARMSDRLGPAHRRTTIVRSVYGYALGMGGDAAAGAVELDRAIEDAGNTTPPDFDLLAKTLERRLRLALAAGDAATAERLIGPLGAAVMKIDASDADAWIGKVDTLRGATLLARARPKAARDALRRAGASLRAGTGADPVTPVEQRLLLARACTALGDRRCARERAAEGRSLLDSLAYPPSRLVSLAGELAE